MTQHTPGPWKVSNRFDIYEDAGPQYGGTYIGTTRGNGDLPASIERVDEANAKLIAAAPDLLESLKELAEMIEEAGWHRSAIGAAKEAIAKAEPRQDFPVKGERPEK